MTLEEKKARLAELKAKLAQMKESASIDAERGGLQAAAERMMVDDPLAAFGLLDKSRALDIKEQQAARERGLGSSEEVRRQLRMNAERAAENSRNPDLDKKVRARYLEEEAVYLAESEKDSPSLQAAAIAVGEIRRGNKKVQGPGPEYDPDTVTYDSAVTSLKEKMQKMKYKDEATKYKPTFLEMIANLAEGDQKTLNGLFDAEAAKLANRPGANVESKDEYNIWKEGFDKSGQMKSIASGIGLGQAMSTALKSYKPGEILSQGDAQKLAAMMYVTYNPGTLQAGEMSSAITAAQGASYSTAAFNLLKSKIGITGIDKVPIEKALVGYNAALEQGGTAWNELQGNLEGRRKGGKQLKFTDLFLGSFRDPVSYKILGKNKDMNDGKALIGTPSDAPPMPKEKPRAGYKWVWNANAKKWGQQRISK